MNTSVYEAEADREPEEWDHDQWLAQATEVVTQAKATRRKKRHDRPGLWATDQPDQWLDGTQAPFEPPTWRGDMVEEDLSGADEGPRRPVDGSSEPVASRGSRTLRHTRVERGEEDESGAHTRYATIISKQLTSARLPSDGTQSIYRA